MILTEEVCPANGMDRIAATLEVPCCMFKILLIDDNIHFRQSLKSLIEHEFPGVVTEDHGSRRDILQNIADFRPDLVFLDLNSAIERRLELARTINTLHPEIIILTFSSYYLNEYRHALYEAGIDLIISKNSWTGRDIMGLLKKLIENHPGNKFVMPLKQPKSAGKKPLTKKE